jgi:son of sevenless-like protein
VDPVEVARQLTLLEQQFFGKIDPLECLYYRGDQKVKNGQPPLEGQNIRNMINQSNKVTGWVAESILLEKDLKRRGQLLKHFIKIADNCHSLNNFATREAILAALNSTPIFRLKKTWEV